jgi:hypothetical protein
MGFELAHVDSAKDVGRHLRDDGAVAIDKLLGPAEVAHLRGLLDRETRRAALLLYFVNWSILPQSDWAAMIPPDR